MNRTSPTHGNVRRPAFENFEFEGWQRSVTEYHQSFAQLTKQTNPTMLEQLRVQPGQRLLDLACGPGDLARLAAAAGSKVTAVDFSPNMLALAQSGTEDEIEFIEANVERLTGISDRSFDSVAMNFGILHLARPEAAIAEAFRVLKPGGGFAFSTWKRPNEAEGFRVVLDALERYGDSNVGLPHGPNFFFYSDPEECQQALERAGFIDVALRFVSDMKWHLAGRDALFVAFAEGTARTGGLLRAQTQEVADRIRIEISKVAATYEDEDGTLSIPMPAIVASGRRP